MGTRLVSAPYDAAGERRGRTTALRGKPAREWLPKRTVQMMNHPFRAAFATAGLMALWVAATVRDIRGVAVAAAIAFVASWGLWSRRGYLGNYYRRRYDETGHRRS